MKARVYLSLGALLLFLAPLGCSDKAESPAPEAPPEEQPTPEPEPEKPEFVDANKSMEEYMKTEDPDCYYTYFRMQNASQENVIFFISTKMSASGQQIVIAPGEQGTWGQTMEKMPWIDDNDVLAKNLDALGFVELYFNPDLEGRLSGICWLELDTCAQYSFFEPMTESQRGTPRSKSSPTARTPSVGPTGLPTRTIRKPYVRRSNDGPTGTRKRRNETLEFCV